MSDVTNSVLVTPPTEAASKIALSTTGTGTTGAIVGGSWYSFRAVGSTAYFVVGITGLTLPAASVAWEIPAGQREDYFVRNGLTRVRASSAETGASLKYRRSGG